MKTQTQYCEWGMVDGCCFDEYPPIRIWKGVHEVGLPKEGNLSVIFVCSYCLNLHYIDDEDKEEGEDYDLDIIDREALDKWNSEESKRNIKRAEYLERNSR